MAAPKPQPFVHTIVAGLLKSESDRLTETLKGIIRANHRAGGTDKAFLFDGRLYCLVPVADVRGSTVSTLYSSFRDEMLYYLSEVEALRRTEQRLRQGLSVVTTKCQTLADFRDALPDILVRDIDQFRGIPRTRPVAFMLEGNQRLKDQFDQTVEMALEYAGRRLLY